MSKLSPVGADARFAPYTSSLLDKIAGTLGCDTKTFFEAPVQQRDQTDEMTTLWRKLSSTKERATVLEFMRALTAQTGAGPAVTSTR